MPQDLKRAIEKELLLFFADKKKEVSFEIWQKIKAFTMQGGKRIRPQLMYYGYLAGGGRNKKAIIRASCSLELIHSSLLIHDDIIDKDKKRRGANTVWYKFARESGDEHYGYSQAIVVGNIAGSWALEILLSSKFDIKNKLKSIQYFNNMIQIVNWGEFLDVENEFYINTKIGSILKMYEYKTAKYSIEYPLLIGAVLAGGGSRLLEKLSNFAIPAGIAYQIQDDILGIFASKKSFGKVLGSDIREGKRNFLILKTLEKANLSNRRYLDNLLKSGNFTSKDLSRVQKIIKDSGSLDYVQNLSKKLIIKAKSVLGSKIFSNEVKYFLNDLSDYLIQRTN